MIHLLDGDNYVGQFEDAVLRFTYDTYNNQFKLYWTLSNGFFNPRSKLLYIQFKADISLSHAIESYKYSMEDYKDFYLRDYVGSQLMFIHPAVPLINYLGETLVSNTLCGNVKSNPSL